MIKELTEDVALKFKSLDPEYKKNKSVLGRFWGTVATWAVPTRNGRYYSSDLWEKLFSSDLIQERFRNGGIFGELCHPDREEVDMEKIAIVMPEPPKKDKDGNLVGYVDIVDTPCGRIAYQLAKYGYKFGISSRGSGDLVRGANGEEVDPDTYSLTAFDLVEVPGVEGARLSFTESLDTKKYNKTLRQRLTEQLEKASDEERKIMEESLMSLDIKLNEEDEIVNDEQIDAIKDEVVPENIEDDEIEIISEEEADKIYDGEVNGKYPVMPGKYIIKHEPGEKVVAIDNSTEDAWTEEFETEEEAINWLNGEFEVSDIEEELDLGNEADFDTYSVLAHEIYGAIERGLENIPSGHTMPLENVTEADIMKAAAYAVERYRDEHELGEGFGKDKKKFKVVYKDGDEEREEVMDELALANFHRFYADPEQVEIISEEPINESKIDDMYNQWKAESDHNMISHLARLYKGSQEQLETLLNYIQENHIPAEKMDDAAIKLGLQIKESISESCGDKEVVKEEEEVDNVKDESFVNELQEALVKSSELEKDNLSLQEKLSVCNAKEVKLEEELKKYKASTASLSETAKEVKSLKEENNKLTEALDEKEKLLVSNKKRFERLVSQKKEYLDKLDEFKEKINDLSSQIKNLNEGLEKANKKVSDYSLSIKKYQKALTESRDLYIKAKADSYNLSVDEVKSNLKESYQTKDVDLICEDLYNQKKNLSKLPFRITEDTRIKVRASENESIKRDKFFDDDNVDSLLRMTTLYK